MINFDNKKIEQVLSLRIIPKDFLASRKTNTAPDKIPNISQYDIEQNGVSIESLEKCNVPVYRYNTQITIHGIWQETQGRCLGYKSLVKNGNGSFGVKYVAIDGAKKELLIKRSRFSKFRGFKNSQDCYFVINCKHHKQLSIKAVNKIKSYSDMFFGEVRIVRDTVFTGYYYIGVFLQSIPEKNVELFSEKILKISKTAYNIKFGIIEQKRKEDEQAANDTSEKRNAILSEAENMLKAEGFVEVCTARDSFLGVEVYWSYSKNCICFRKYNAKKGAFGRVYANTVSGSVLKPILDYQYTNKPKALSSIPKKLFWKV